MVAMRCSVVLTIVSRRARICVWCAAPARSGSRPRVSRFDIGSYSHISFVEEPSGEQETGEHAGDGGRSAHATSFGVCS